MKYARSAYYTSDVSSPVCSVGAVLLPGAATSLIGTSAGELAGTHTPLDQLWGRDTGMGPGAEPRG